MKFSLLKLSLLALVLVFVINGCKKKKDEEPEYDTTSSEDNSLAENTWNDIGAMADQAATGALASYRPESNGESLLSACATVSPITFDGTDSVITVDFGSDWSSSPCLDGRYRKGKFHIAWNGGYYNTPGVVIRTYADSSDNYCIKFITDGSKWVNVIGTRTVTNRGYNSDSKLWYDVHVDGKIYDNVGRKLTWNSDRQRTWTAGDTTASWSDDRYSISGTADGVSFDGVSFHVAITSALIINLSCPTNTCKITQGIIELTPSGEPARTIDFGSGACDREAVVTVRDIVRTIIIR